VKDKKTFAILATLSSRIDYSIIRTTHKGVPHIVVDNFYSIVYFSSSNSFNVYSDIGTQTNKKVLSRVDAVTVIKYFEDAGYL